MTKIFCSSENEFYDAISELVKRGLGFTANTERLEITLTGSY